MKTLRSFILLLSFLGISVSSYAQFYTGHNKIWAFGSHAGLDFNGGAVNAISTSIGTNEGTATLSDSSGNLLFYTEGQMVWDRNHNMMLGGSMLGPFTTQSTTQGALIVPVIGSQNKYYVFSIADIAPYNGGLFQSSMWVYNIIDMSLNGGLGDVSTPWQGVSMPGYIQEKQIAIPGENCDMWVLVHAANEPKFLAYHVTSAGIDIGNPVVSVIGATKKVTDEWGYGVIKISHDRRKLVSQNCDRDGLGGGTGAGTELFDFDPLTGIVSNGRILDERIGYGAEFSPDNSKLYTCNVRNDSFCSVYQYDITLPSASDIIASRYTVDTESYWMSDLRLGPDSNIYCTYGSTVPQYSIGEYMNRIEKPNLSGSACNFVLKAVTINPTTSGYLGLTNLYWGQLYESRYDTIYTCTKSGTISISSTGLPPYSWSVLTGNASISGAGGTVTVNYDSSATIRISSNGICGFKTEIIKIMEVSGISVDAGADDTISICGGLDTLNATISGNVSGYTVVWNPASSIVSGANSLAPIVKPTANTYYIVSVSLPGTQGQCPLMDSVRIIVDATIYDTSQVDICSGTTLQFGTQSITGAGTFTEHFINSGGCDSIVTVTVNVIDSPTVVDIYASDICEDASQVINATNYPGATYVWNFDGAEQSGTGPGPYTVIWDSSGEKQITVKVTNMCGSATSDKVINIYPKPIADIQQVDIPTLCGGDTIDVTAYSASFYSFEWRNNGVLYPYNASDIRLVPVEGYISVSVKNREGCINSDSIYIRVNPCCIMSLPTAFTPNDDGKNDVFRILTLGHNQLAYFRIMNRFGEMVFETLDISKGWNGTYKGELADIGTYFYVISYRCFDGSSQLLKGDLTLLR